ncbi:M23 family metallopeptidase [Streptomyces mobaraensis]|uniref:M23 family metallopeptidase n=1 Tax=Streptomyces mobaraensis TaxID=35621 RepID=UPI003329F00A
MASNRSAGGDGSHGSWAESPYGDEPGSSPAPPPPGGADGSFGGSFEGQGPYDVYGSFESPGTSGSPGPYGAYDTYDVFSTSDSYDGIGTPGETEGAGAGVVEDGVHAESVAPAGPGAEYEPPVRGRHRVPKQRGGSMARSGAVLGVGVIAAVGAGGMANAQERPAAISVPDVSHLPGAGPYLIDDGDDGDGAEAAAPAYAEPDAHQADAHQAAAATADASRAAADAAATDAAATDAADAGEALRARILQQADHQRHSADAEATHEAHEAQKTQEAHQTHQASQTPQAQERAAADAQRMAAAKATADRKARTTAQAAHAATARTAAAHPTASQHADNAAHAGRPHAAGNAAKAWAEATAAAQSSVVKATGQAQAEARRTAERITAARAKRTYVLPVSSYRITARFGQAGGMWSHRHTGTDFAAPTGSPVKAVHGGTITHAGWAGSYGYRIVLRLDDGTELWFCHLSSIVRTKGKVAAGQVIGRVGATGNVTGAHLHLEVRPHGGHPVDPLHWLRSKGLRP